MTKRGHKKVIKPDGTEIDWEEITANLKAAFAEGGEPEDDDLPEETDLDGTVAMFFRRAPAKPASRKTGRTSKPGKPA
jgi:hypothetical protein